MSKVKVPFVNGPFEVKALTIEDQIAQIEKEAQEKIKELRKSLPWEKQFAGIFDKYIKENRNVISNIFTGNRPQDSELRLINQHLADSGLAVQYNSCTFDNDIQNQVSFPVHDPDASEYPVYTVLVVKSGTETLGYIRINCEYSSYNGNEYSNWQFVRAKEITCKVFIPYNP